MYCCPARANQAIPAEFRNTAEALFPPEGGDREVSTAARGFAEILGIGADYRRLLGVDKSGPEMRCFLGHFQNNLDLLIRKTWVEKADEVRKEKLQDRIPPLIAGIEGGHYRQTLAEFGSILEEMAYLFFGADSHKDDFTEYTFRIDTQMGLFWWYAAHIGGFGHTGAAAQEDLWAVLLLGICYLTNF